MRRIALKALLAALLTTRAMADYSNTVMSLSPLGYWRLNETNLPPADVATNSGTLGASANGYYVAGATHPVPGALVNGTGTAATFPGTNSSRVVVPYQPTIAAAAPFSVEFWANPAAPTNTMCVASLTQFGNPPGNGDGTRKGWLFYQNSATGWTFRTYGTNNTAYAATVTQTVTAGQWYHIVGVYDGTNNLLYVNGQLAATIAAPSYVPVAGNESPFSVGGRGYGALGSFSFIGSVDEVAYYTNILSAANVLAHYQNGTSASPAIPYAQLVEAKAPPLYLHFDEPAFAAADPSTYPVAVNLGSDGADINGAYDPGTTPGAPGVPYLGFDTNNFATLFGPEQGGEINLGLSEALDFTGPFSIVLWFKTGPADDRFQSFIGKSDNSWRGGIDSSGFVHFAFGSNPDVIGTMDLNDGVWHQYAGVYDGTNLYLYIDGQLNGTEANVAAALGDPSNPVLIGSAGDYGDGRVFKGTIDEVAAFTNILTATQLQQLYFAADAPPIITQAPSSPVTADEGTSTTFAAEAFGFGTLAYQWQFNGTNLTGKTSTNLVLSAVQISQSGNYALVVTNIYGAVTSSVVALSVQAGPPNLVSNPSSAIRYTGGSVTFAATANGSAPLSYQWQFGGGALAGQTGTNLTLSNLQNAEAGNYSVAISNTHGAITSSIVTLALVPAPTSPYAQAVLADGPIAYWRLGETNGITAYDYVGGYNGSYTNVLLGQLGYSAYDTNTAATFGPADDSLVGNIPVIDFATNTGLRSFSLECWLNAPPQTSDSAIITKGTGGGGEQFDIDFGSSGAIRFLYRDASGAVTLLDGGVLPDSNWHHIVAVVDAVNLQAAIYIDGNQQATATITPTGILASPQSMTIGSRQSGTTAFDDQLYGTVDEVAVYATALTAQQVQNHFNARYPASVPPAISVQPASTTNYVSLSSTFSVTAGGVDLSYQWLSNSVPISGANSSTLTLGPLDYPDAAKYQVAVQNEYGTTTSSNANLTILAPPTTLNLTSGLVLHLPFNNSLVDTSGQNNNGTNVGATSFVSDGKLGSALHYFTDTSIPSYNYVTLGYRPILNFSSNVNFSVSYWVRVPNGVLTGDLPFICNAIGSTYSPGYTFTPSYQTGGWAWSLNGVASVGAGISINDGSWHHLVHTFDRTSDGITYLDGVAVDSHEDYSAGDIDETNATNIGQDPTGTYSQTASADIEDIGIWRRVLTPLEVASIYVGANSNAISFASASSPSPTLSIAPSGGKVQVSWTGSATLQAAGSLTGAFTNVTGATSPYVVTPTNSQTFFRLSIP
jgi:hypothetical protein